MDHSKNTHRQTRNLISGNLSRPASVYKSRIIVYLYDCCCDYYMRVHKLNWHL